MLEVTTEATTDAPAHRVWQALTEVHRYPEWHPLIHTLRAELRSGGWGLLVLKAGRGRTVSLPIRYQAVVENEELSWKGGIDRLFTGTHYFRLQPLEDGGTRLEHGERFEGRVADVTMPLVKARLQVLYQRVTEAVCRQAETRR